ncbi:MAG: lysophospholipid acyltransferase family protein [Anaerolineales bacterium]
MSSKLKQVIMVTMNPMRWLVTYGCKLGLEVMCRIHKENWDSIPSQGPLITYANHTGMVEAPLIFTQLMPRPATALAKIETWDNWFLGWVFTLWEIIPIRRGEADMEALRAALDALKQGKFLGISPEGTRNRTGQLLRAHGGAALLALKSGSPLLPIAHWGGEDFLKNLKRFKRTDFYIRVGKPFVLDAGGERVTNEIRQQMTDEMMYQLAKLLPEYYRGEYADLEKATEKYIRWL